MIALFFNPFGFDAVQYGLILWTGSLWKANFVLYCIAVVFFGLYIYFRRLSKKPKSGLNCPDLNASKLGPFFK